MTKNATTTGEKKKEKKKKKEFTISKNEIKENLKQKFVSLYFALIQIPH